MQAIQAISKNGALMCGAGSNMAVKDENETIHTSIGGYDTRVSDYSFALDESLPAKVRYDTFENRLVDLDTETIPYASQR